MANLAERIAQATDNLLATVRRHRAALSAVEDLRRALADAEHEARQVAHYLDLEARQLESLRQEAPSNG